MEKTNLIINSSIDIGGNIELETNGKGRHFVSRFIEAGVAHYEQFGDVLITKETLDKFINSMVGCPVIIKHKDITDENADKERVGVVSRVWFNEADGWYWCEGIIWDKQAIDLIKNQGWNVSCTYDFESDKLPKTHNGKKVDMEFTDGEFLHLALVPNPRYERANIVINSKAENEDKWITIHPNGEDAKGRHLLLKDGESPKEAIERIYGKGDNKDKYDEMAKDIISKYGKEEIKKGLQMPYTKDYVWKLAERKEGIDKTALKDAIEKQLKEEKKEEPKDVTKEEHAEITEKVKKMSDDELIKAHFESQKGYESETSKAGSLSKHEATYGIIAQELKKRTGRSFSPASSEKEIREALEKQSDKKVEKKYNYTLTKREVEDRKMFGGMADTGNYYTNGDFAIDKKYLNIKGQEPTKREEIEKSLKNILKGDSAASYTPVKDFEVGELKRNYGKPIKVAKYSYFDEKYGYERNIYINKKYNDLFKNFDLKFGGETKPVFAYDGKDIVGVVMPIYTKDQHYSKVENEVEEDYEINKNQLALFGKAENALLNGLDEILTDYKPIKEDLPILNGLKDILTE